MRHPETTKRRLEVEDAVNPIIVDLSTIDFHTVPESLPEQCMTFITFILMVMAQTLGPA